MDDLISRNAACDVIGEMIKEYREKGEDDLADGLILARRYGIKCLPAVSAAPVVRCAYCKHCFDMGSDPMEPYDGESEWYCARFDRDTSAYEIDPYRYSMSAFCKNCAYYESEWQYCFKVGCHAPETGYCGGWKEKVEPKEG